MATVMRMECENGHGMAWREGRYKHVVENPACASVEVHPVQVSADELAARHVRYRRIIAGAADVRQPAAQVQAAQVRRAEAAVVEGTGGPDAWARLLDRAAGL